MKKTFAFLKSLKSHNDREWFEKHKPQYLEAREEVIGVVQQVLNGIKKFDNKIDKDEDAADCLFRIYKDVRFSKDKSPYKTHFGASMNPGGRKSPVPGYYIHIEPGNSFVAGGVWSPEPPVLNAIRQEIDYHPDEFLSILKAKSFKKYFADLSDEGKLKTAPKGYPKDHKHIELLKHRHYIVVHEMPDKIIGGPGAAKYATEAFKAMFPLMTYLRKAMS